MNYVYMYQLIHTVNNPRLITVRYYPFMTKGDHRSVISRGGTDDDDPDIFLFIAL